MEPENTTEQNPQKPQQNEESASEKKPRYIRKRIIVICGLIIIIILLFASIIGVYLQKNSLSETLTTEAEPQSKKTLQKIPKKESIPVKNYDKVSDKETYQIMSELQKEFGTKSTISEFGSTWWELSDNTKIIIAGHYFNISAEEREDSGYAFTDVYKQLQAYKAPHGYTVYDPNDMTAYEAEVEEITDNFFLNKGFEFNSSNSEKDTYTTNNFDGEREERIRNKKAYEKDEMYCWTTITGTRATFTCGLIDEDHTNLQNTVGKELKPIFNPDNNPNIIILVQRTVGDFATGAVTNIEGPTAGFYAKKTDGEWITIPYHYQIGYFDCSVIEEFDIPDELMPDNEARENCYAGPGDIRPIEK